MKKTVNKGTLNRIHHRFSPEEKAKAEDYAKVEREKSLVAVSDKDPERHKAELSNKEYAKLPGFITQCENVGVEPTSRQASKFRKRCGKVFNNKV